MASLNKARAKLQEKYRQSMGEKLRILQSLKEQLKAENEETFHKLKRFAHQLHGSGASYGFADISKYAADVEYANSDQIMYKLDYLLDCIRQECYTTDETVHLYTDIYTLLIVEDDIEQALLVKEAFSIHSPHWNILIAESVEEAEHYLQKNDIDAIILDLILSEKDGRELLIELRAKSATAAIPIVVVSIINSIDTKRECLGLGADFFFDKPLDTELLALFVMGSTERHRILLMEGQTDKLTGLVNRSAFKSIFQRQCSLADRTEMSISLAFIDIDYFKNINDTYGHGVGDQVLMQVGALLNTKLRQIDIAARWGGEEFIVLLPSTNLKGAEIALNKIRKHLREYVFRTAQGDLTGITFSAGIAQVETDKPLLDNVEKADRLLYLAKKAGRDRLFMEGEEQQPDVFNVLVVEDDPDMSDYISFILNREGYITTCCNDGEMALILTEKQTFDLVLLDAMLPSGLTGFRLLKELRSRSAYGKVPILMLTALNTVDNLELAFQSGIDDYLTKPFQERELVARIKRFLKTHSVSNVS